MDARVPELLKKYDVQVPRYTSYPTVPYWDSASIDAGIWQRAVLGTFQAEEGAASLYVHLPYCESLCTFCACNKRITRDHGVEDPYIRAVLREWSLYRNLLPGAVRIQEIHLGGGTPTFFSPGNLEKLASGLVEGCRADDGAQFSVEVHPNGTGEAHLDALARAGFQRISLGVQDFDPAVQVLINRIQTFEQTARVVAEARSRGFASVNVDLVYGLPGQTVRSVEETIARIREIAPDRIAFYSYAHVPWKSKVQRLYTEADLPGAAAKWAMYHRGFEMLSESGFIPIGMDHFALPSDSLFAAVRRGALHRNFMGYTTTTSKLLIGLGVSSISDAWTAFVQNEKSIDLYLARVEGGEWPVAGGHRLDGEDLLLRRLILDLMCRGEADVPWERLEPRFAEASRSRLDALAGDGLVELDGSRIRATSPGRVLIRTVSAALDARLWRQQREGDQFSRAI